MLPRNAMSFASGHSTTKSARASNVAGTVTPSALAVFKLMCISYLVGCSIGRLLALALLPCIILLA